MNPEVRTLPARPLPDDVIDQVAREIALEVAWHIERMYPEAANAVAWKSASRSIQGVVRNRMASAGRAAENGEIEKFLDQCRRSRKDERAACLIGRQGQASDIRRD